LLNFPLVTSLREAMFADNQMHLKSFNHKVKFLTW